MLPAVCKVCKKTCKLTPCKYKHNFCLKLPHYSRICYMYSTDEFYECMESCKKGVFRLSGTVPNQHTPKPSGQIDDILDVSVMSVRWHILADV